MLYSFYIRTRIIINTILKLYVDLNGLLQFNRYFLLIKYEK